MTPEQKNEIIAYLQGPRDYYEGVDLYRKYGTNKMFKQLFAHDETTFHAEMLTDELRKLAELTPAELARLPRLAHRPTVPAHAKTVIEKQVEHSEAGEEALMELADSFGITVDELVSPEFADRVLAMDENADRIDELEETLEKARSTYAEAPDVTRKMIRFRERYPFLNSADCPDVLKILVADMFTAYGEYKTAFVMLQTIPDEDVERAAIECSRLVESYLANREIWDELEHYRRTGQILGKAAKFRELEAVEDLAALSDVELLNKLKSAQVNTSKHKSKMQKAQKAGTTDDNAAAQYQKWTARKLELEAELERRKKK